MINGEKFREEAKNTFNSIAGVEEYPGFDTYYDEDNVPILDVLKYKDSTEFIFHNTGNKYRFDEKVDVNGLFN